MWCSCKQRRLVTVVQLPHQLNVPWAHSIALTYHLEIMTTEKFPFTVFPYRLHVWVVSFDPDPIPVPTNIAGIFTIVHQTVEVIWKSKVVGIMFFKVCFVIRVNVFPENLDKVVPVHTTLGVEKTYGMEKLVLYDSGGEMAIF